MSLAEGVVKVDVNSTKYYGMMEHAFHKNIFVLIIHHVQLKGVHAVAGHTWYMINITADIYVCCIIAHARPIISNVDRGDVSSLHSYVTVKQIVLTHLMKCVNI